MISQGDGSLESGANIIMTMTGIIAVTNPELKAIDRGQILRDLGLLDDDVDLNNIKSETIRNGVKYSLYGSEQVGLMFAADKPNK